MADSVDFLEARLHRQDLQIQKIMEAQDELTATFIDIRGRLDVALADRNDLKNDVLLSIGGKFYEMAGIYG
jgi:hypothetical protein